MSKKEKEIARGVYAGTMVTVLFYLMVTADHEGLQIVAGVGYIFFWFMINSNNYFIKKGK